MYHDVTIHWYNVSEVRNISAASPDLILRSLAQARRLEGWPRATAVQAGILRDAPLATLAALRRWRAGCGAPHACLREKNALNAATASLERMRSPNRWPS